MPDTIFNLVGEWFDDETSSTRRADLLSQIRDRWIVRGPFLATVHGLRTIRSGADVGKVGWVDVGDLSTEGWPAKPLFRGCIPGNEAGVSWTFEREVAAEYARVRGGRVISLRAWHHLPILGAIVSRVPAGGVTEELLVGAVDDGWVES